VAGLFTVANFDDIVMLSLFRPGCWGAWLGQAGADRAVLRLHRDLGSGRRRRVRG